MPAARYWRAFFWRSMGSTVVGLREMSLRSGGVDQMSAVGGVAISSADFNAGTPASNLFDGTAAIWASPNWYNDSNRIWHWAGAKFNSPVDIDSVTMQSRTDVGSLNQEPKEFMLQYSFDGAVWLTKWCPPVQAAWTLGEVRTFTCPAITATSSYWRIFGTATDHGTIMALAEVEWRATRGGANQATGGTPLASSEYDASHVAANAYDGNATTRWAALVSWPPWWLGYQFTSAVGMREMRVVARNENNAFNQAPRDFDAQQSPDGLTWVTVASYQRIRWTTLGQAVLAYIPAYAPDDEIAVLGMGAAALSGTQDKLTAASLRSMAALGGAQDRLTAASVRAIVATGGYPDRITAGAMRATAAVGGYPDRIAAAGFRASVLFRPALRPLNGPVQII